MILNLTVYLGKAVLFPKDFSWIGLDFSMLFWTIISFIALYRLKINTILWIGISAIFGIAKYLLDL